ncbi:hypothetical protein AYR47_20395 [Pseudomonas azotoformans]|uniref:TniQ family protein n=2 Tax=Pseudomonas azotoformans TaxID=47878 RepID=A0A127I194_PSEAZ|nr:hypothetical protein AYR47_20395 [Pseudomonas azotoformans]
MIDLGRGRELGTRVARYPEQINNFSAGPIDPFESVYAALARFAMDNTLSKQELAAIFKSRLLAGPTPSHGLGSKLSVRHDQLSKILSISLAQINNMFYRWRPTPQNSTSLSFRYCAICASARRHYTVFQLEGLRTCPLHHVPLRTACSDCGQPMLYGWSSKLLNIPFACGHCKTLLGAQHGRRIFFDLHTDFRARKLAKVNGCDVSGFPQGQHSADAVAVCQGYLVYGNTLDSEEEWREIVELPLSALGVEQRDWHSREGYIQIRGPRGRSWAANRVTDVSSRIEELSRYLMQCLKCFFRHKRKVWRLTHPWFGGVRRPVVALNLLDFRRELGYDLLWKHWYGSSPSTLEVGRQIRDVDCLIQKWLREAVFEASVCNTPARVQVWLVTHKFFSWVTESLEAVSRIVERPSLHMNDCVSEGLQRPRRPLWLTVFIESASCSSYRVVRHQPLACCLSSRAVWNGDESL